MCPEHSEMHFGHFSCVCCAVSLHKGGQTPSPGLLLCLSVPGWVFGDGGSVPMALSPWLCPQVCGGQEWPWLGQGSHRMSWSPAALPFSAPIPAPSPVTAGIYFPALASVPLEGFSWLHFGPELTGLVCVLGHSAAPQGGVGGITWVTAPCGTCCLSPGAGAVPEWGQSLSTAPLASSTSLWALEFPPHPPPLCWAL